MFRLGGLLGRVNLGQWGEEYTAELYRKQGYTILEKNYANRFGKRVGEIDLIAIEGKELIFIEVKTRTNQAFGTAAESVTPSKQKKLIRACKYYLHTHQQYQDYNYRIDVALIHSDLDKKNVSATILTNAVEDNR